MGGQGRRLSGSWPPRPRCSSRRRRQRPPCAGACTSAMASLSPCVDYMSGIGSSEATALGRCCRQLRSVGPWRGRCRNASAPCAGSASAGRARSAFPLLDSLSIQTLQRSTVKDAQQVQRMVVVWIFQRTRCVSNGGVGTHILCSFQCSDLEQEQAHNIVKRQALVQNKDMKCRNRVTRLG